MTRLAIAPDMDPFQRDDKWQRDMRDAVLAPSFYPRLSDYCPRFAPGGRFRFLDGDDSVSIHMQRKRKLDTVVQLAEGRAASIDEKIVRWPEHRDPYTAFCLETKSCTVEGHETDGWMRNGTADFLLWCFAQRHGALVCWLIGFPELQAWFWKHESKFSTFGPHKHWPHSFGRVVPFGAVCRSGVPVLVRDEMTFAKRCSLLPPYEAAQP